MKKDSDLPISACPDASNTPARNLVVNQQEHVANPDDIPAPPSLVNRKFLVPPQPGSRPRTTDSFKSVPFSDLPYYIPNIRAPYVSFNGAINIAGVEVNKEKGLLFILMPYLDKAEFDHLELFFKDPSDPVASYTINQDDVDSGRAIPLYVPPTRIIHGPANPVFVRLTRLGGSTNETLHLNLFIDLARPGGRNPVASTVQNENLALPVFPQHLIDFGVGQEDIGSPIPVQIKPYPVNTALPTDTFRKARDRIRLSIGGVIVVHSVTEAEAGGAGDIVIMVNTSTWTSIGSGSHVCEYEVVDEAGNHSDGWSPAQILDVQLDDGSEPLLPMTFVQEAPENILDHDALVGDAHVFIFISGNGYALGDIIRVTVNGRTVEGEPLVTTYDSAPLTSTTAVYITVPVPNADIKALVGGRFQLRYKRIRSDVPDRNSRSNIVDVIGTALPVGLAPPYVIEATGDTLNPQELFFNVVIPSYQGQNYFDLVTLVFAGTYANGNAYYREDIDVAGDGEGIRLISNGPLGDINKLEGGTLEIYYTVQNESGVRASRGNLYNVGQPAASLLEPLVLEAPAPGYQFDPAVSLGNASVRVQPDTDIKEGDTVRLYALGNAPGGTPTLQPFPITDFWEGRPLPFTLPRANVLPNTVMRIYYARERLHAPTRFSHQVDMNVGSAPELGVPTVLEATVVGPTSSTLNPTHVVSPPVFTVRVDYSPMFASDDITVKLIVKPGLTAPIITPKPGNPSQGYVDFTVSNTNIADHIGEILKIQYHVRRAGADYDSGILDLLVLNFDELPGGNPLPQAAINDLPSNTTLDLNLFASDAMAGVIPWPLMRANQRVWLTVERAGVAPHKVLDGYLVLASEVSAGIKNKAVSRTWLDQLANGSKISLRCAVAFDGGNETNAINFPITEYNIVSKLSVDNSLLTLDGISVRVNWPRSGADSIGNTAVRQAKGGHPNYTYTSNNQAVANVDPLSGKVTGNKNGTATISIKDDKNNTVSYPVTVRNVFNLITNDNFVTADKAVQWRQSLSNGTIISQAALLDMHRTYINPLPTRQHYWYCDPAPGSCHDDARRFFHRENQGNYCAIIPGGNIAAWCMQPT